MQHETLHHAQDVKPEEQDKNNAVTLKKLNSNVVENEVIKTQESAVFLEDIAEISSQESEIYTPQLKTQIYNIANAAIAKIPEFDKIDLEDTSETFLTKGVEVFDFMSFANVIYLATNTISDSTRWDKMFLFFRDKGGYIPHKIIEDFYFSTTKKNRFLEKKCYILAKNYFEFKCLGLRPLFVKSFLDTILKLTEKLTTEAQLKLGSFFIQSEQERLEDFQDRFLGGKLQNSFKELTIDIAIRIKKILHYFKNDSVMELVELKNENKDSFCGFFSIGIKISYALGDFYKEYQRLFLNNTVKICVVEFDKMVREMIWGEDGKMIRLLCCGGINCHVSDSSVSRANIYLSSHEQADIIWIKSGVNAEQASHKMNKTHHRKEREKKRLSVSTTSFALSTSQIKKLNSPTGSVSSQLSNVGVGRRGSSDTYMSRVSSNSMPYSSKSSKHNCLACQLKEQNQKSYLKQTASTITKTKKKWLPPGNVPPSQILIDTTLFTTSTKPSNTYIWKPFYRSKKEDVGYLQSKAEFNAKFKKVSKDSLKSNSNFKIHKNNNSNIYIQEVHEEIVEYCSIHQEKNESFKVNYIVEQNNSYDDLNSDVGSDSTFHDREIEEIVLNVGQLELLTTDAFEEKKEIKSSEQEELEGDNTSTFINQEHNCKAERLDSTFNLISGMDFESDDLMKTNYTHDIADDVVLSEVDEVQRNINLLLLSQEDCGEIELSKIATETTDGFLERIYSLEVGEVDDKISLKGTGIENERSISIVTQPSTENLQPQVDHIIDDEKFMELSNVSVPANEESSELQLHKKLSIPYLNSSDFKTENSYSNEVIFGGEKTLIDISAENSSSNSISSAIHNDAENNLIATNCETNHTNKNLNNELNDIDNIEQNIIDNKKEKNVPLQEDTLNPSPQLIFNKVTQSKQKQPSQFRNFMSRIVNFVDTVVKPEKVLETTNKETENNLSGTVESVFQKNCENILNTDKSDSGNNPDKKDFFKSQKNSSESQLIESSNIGSLYGKFGASFNQGERPILIRRKITIDPFGNESVVDTEEELTEEMNLSDGEFETVEVGGKVVSKIVRRVIFKQESTENLCEDKKLEAKSKELENSFVIKRRIIKRTVSVNEIGEEEVCETEHFDDDVNDSLVTKRRIIHVNESGKEIKISEEDSANGDFSSNGTNSMLKNFVHLEKIVELDQIEDGNEIQNYLASKTGQRSIPNNFISGKHVGGNDTLQILKDTGELQKLISKI
ncbi:glutaredoxin [Lobulomyces angularis]|nr:glutaredoxin [Lobulomyces angularis]